MAQGSGGGGGGGDGGGGEAGLPGPGEYEVWRALVPTTPLTETGPRALRVALPWAPLGPRVTAELEVRPRDFPCERVQLPPGKAPLDLGARPGSSEARRLARWRRLRTRERLWDPRRPFSAPAGGAVTTGYGVRRVFGSAGAAPLEGYFHRGVDFGAPPGTPAVAPAAGTVSLVGCEEDGFASAGTCVGVDHGQGVQSLLLHLEAACVREGDSVAAGQPVGQVGTSGASTGPHLHWGLFVHGESVDPSPWLAGTPRASPWGT